jgi:crotonobetainyl-CoA:carnitine CoA-transferase CaiB-like acyl-CoA transferase
VTQAHEAATPPLAGLLVVALEQAVAAPMASCRLADAGARVIKIERPDGDFARGYDRAGNGGSSYFSWLNRGKESLVLDIKDAADAALLHRVLERADVFIQNLAAGAAERAGFGSKQLRAKYPRLITCDISGYGEDGPYARMKAYDLLVQAESGLASVSGPPGNPARIGVSVCDIATGVSAALAIHEALRRRDRTGHGEGVAISLFDVIAEWMTVPLLHYDYLGAAPVNMGMAHPTVAPYGAFSTADRRTLIISVQNDREWHSFARDVLRDASLAADARFATNVDRVSHRRELDDLIQACFGSMSQAAVVERLLAAQIAFGTANDVAELSVHPQLRRIEIGSEHGVVSMPAHPLLASAWPVYGRVPAIGEHTEAIRREFGGLK